MNSESSLSLSALYSRALKTASKASSLPTIEDETQEYIDATLADLNALRSRINVLHLFSSNETIDEVSTKDLVYMSVPFIQAEVELNARATQRDERMLHLRKAQALLRSFISLLEDYDVIPEDERRLYGRSSTNAVDPAKRRETKIAQFKKEKELKTKIEALRKRRGLPELDMTNNYDVVDSLLPSTDTGDQDEGDDDVARDSVLLLLRLQWAQTSAHVSSMEQELELLHNAPPLDPEEQLHTPQSADNTWRLDIPQSSSLASQQGPLLDVSGRPIRPFTILPARASERARLQSEVFRPDHRLPSMTIDEYLEEERRRGRFVSGGGPQSESALTRKEQLALDAEMDGTVRGYEKAEEKRQEDERWSQFTDLNPRGAGNTMNRG